MDGGCRLLSLNVRGLGIRGGGRPRCGRSHAGFRYRLVGLWAMLPLLAADLLSGRFVRATGSRQLRTTKLRRIGLLTLWFLRLFLGRLFKRNLALDLLTLDLLGGRLLRRLHLDRFLKLLFYLRVVDVLPVVIGHALSLAGGLKHFLAGFFLGKHLEVLLVKTHCQPEVKQEAEDHAELQAAEHLTL